MTMVNNFYYPLIEIYGYNYNGSDLFAGWFDPKILMISRLQLQLEYQKFALKTMRFTGTVIISGFILGWWLLIFICIDCIIELKVYFLRQNFEW